MVEPLIEYRIFTAKLFLCPKIKECYDKSHVTRNLLFAYAKTKVQISYTVTAQLIRAFVFAT